MADTRVIQQIDTTFDGVYYIDYPEDPSEKILLVKLVGNDEVEYFMNIPELIIKDGSGSLEVSTSVLTKSEVESHSEIHPYDDGGGDDPTPEPPIPEKGISFSYNNDTCVVAVNYQGSIETFKLKDSQDIVFRYIVKALNKISDSSVNFNFSYNPDTATITVDDNGTISILKLGNEYDDIFKYIFRSLNNLVDESNYVTMNVNFEDVQPDSSYDDKVIIGYNG